MVSGTTNGTISLPSSSSSTSFTVASTNVNWSITGMPSWVSLSAISGGNGNTVVNVIHTTVSHVMDTLIMLDVIPSQVGYGILVIQELD